MFTPRSAPPVPRRSGRFRWSCIGRAGLAVVVLLGSAGSALAQATGTLAGRVVDARTGAPLDAAQVFLAGTNLGTLSSTNGRFVITGVAPGTYELRAERLGFATATQQVAVRAGETEVVELLLEEQAIGLDQIVVTGEAGAARQREVGNAISQLTIADMVEPPRDVEEMLGGRIAGAVITENTGSAGSGNFIRLRGINSMSMSNQPLIYIDGIRTRSEPYDRNWPRGDRSNRSGNVQMTPLADINPEDVERVEVIKGAAATALYGSEASAGVIQIFTKRGVQGGRPQWSVGTSQNISMCRSTARRVATGSTATAR